MMTKNRFDKQAIRERMALTGEPYSVAAREISQLPLTTWSKLDEVIDGGFRRGSIYLIGSRAGDGGSTFAANLAAKFSRSNTAVAYATLELSAEELRNNLLRVDTEPKSQLVRNVHVTNGQTVAELRAFVQNGPNIKVLIVDYFQLLTTEIEAENHFTRTAQVGEELKRLAVDLDVVVIALARTARGVDSSALTSSRAFESGSLMTTADVVSLVASEDGASLEFTLIKNRFGASESSVRFALFDGYRSTLS
jgi:replicative DNA helicase